MIVVVGTFEVAPQDREAFLASRVEGTSRSRGEPGCVQYNFGADLLDPGVVVLTERWATRADLDTHLAGLKGAPAPTPAVKVLSRKITIYETLGEGTDL